MAFLACQCRNTKSKKKKIFENSQRIKFGTKLHWFLENAGQLVNIKRKFIFYKKITCLICRTKSSFAPFAIFNFKLCRQNSFSSRHVNVAGCPGGAKTEATKVAAFRFPVSHGRHRSFRSSPKCPFVIFVNSTCRSARSKFNQKLF